jgi:hypothetical protein
MYDEEDQEHSEEQAPADGAADGEDKDPSVLIRECGTHRSLQKEAAQHEYEEISQAQSSSNNITSAQKGYGSIP